MENLSSENARPASSISHDPKNKLSAAQSKMMSAAHRVEEKIADEASHVVERASHYLSASRQYVKENPAKSVAVAAVSGLALGGLISAILRKRS